MAKQLSVFVLMLAWIGQVIAAPPPERLEIGGDPIGDPDDMCFVVLEPSNEVFLVVSDKRANAVFLIDNRGQIVDRATFPLPGNIDARPAFPFKLNGEENPRTGNIPRSPLVVVNARLRRELVAFTVSKTDAGPRLRRLPSEMPMGANYGGCLYRGENDRFYFFSTTIGGLVQQFEIIDKGDKLRTQRVRAWESPICEGAVADDEHGSVFLCEERVGIRKVSAEPNHQANAASDGRLEARTDDELIVKVGDHQIRGDLEGITILKTGERTGYLIASDQGRSQFVVLKRQAPHEYVGTFSVPDVRNTDGVDVFAEAFGANFPNGVFACHTDGIGGGRILISPLSDKALSVLQAGSAK